MTTNILVAYASKYGATEEIAEKIGETLNQAGLSAEVKSADGVKDLSPYQAVVLGSAVYIGKWRKQAVKFIKVHEKRLGELPVWIFSSGPTGKGDPVGILKGWRNPKEIQPIIERIQPRDVVVFHGDVDEEKLTFIERSMIQTVEAPLGDFRDWDAIRSWAGAIADELR